MIEKNENKNNNYMGLAPVAHACNSSYLGGSNQEDLGSKPARANSSTRPSLEKPFRKIGLLECLRVSMSSSPSTAKKKKKKKRIT
jgi:hypothetical protein